MGVVVGFEPVVVAVPLRERLRLLEEEKLKAEGVGTGVEEVMIQRSRCWDFGVIWMETASFIPSASRAERSLARRGGVLLDEGGRSS